MPSNYKIRTEKKISTALCYGRILKVKTPIEIKDLKGYPKDYRKNINRTVEKTIVYWTPLDSLDDKEEIISVVRQTLDFGDYQQIENLLMQIEDDDNEFYFAGLGSVSKGLDNEKYNFYQFMYFMNMSTNTIYEWDDIH